MSNPQPAGQTRRPARALVLSGGGGRGAFQCGVIEELARRGWTPDVLVGTSIGSHNAALWATGGAARVSAFWDTVTTGKMHRFWRLGGWGGLMDRRPWARTLAECVPESELARATTPLYLVTTNITTGQPVVFTNDRDLDSDKPFYQKVTLGHRHLLASSAIPLYYPPVQIDGASYWDGAVMYNSPLAPAIDAGASEVVAVLLSPFRDLSAARPPAAPPSLPPHLPGVAGLIGLVLDLAITATFENDYNQLQRVNEQVAQAQARAAHRDVRCEVIAPSQWLTPLDIVRYKRDQIARLREQGRREAGAALDRLAAG